MNQRIIECIENRQESYIFPFLWLHGESHERLREEILAVKNCGLSEFCAESRPHEAFCQEKWWEDFSFILQTARELDMKVWLLDDKLFPTGYANGYLKAKERAYLRKKLVREVQSEAIGPAHNVKILVSGWLRQEMEEEIVSIIAYPHCGEEEKLDAWRAIDLTGRLADGYVYWDVPEGVWRICIVIRTESSDKEERFRYYIDMLNRESCQSMIHAVYEPHYEHFKEYFGNTFRGFFSDEPGFLNNRGTYLGKLGVMQECYPWRNDLAQLIAESCGRSEREVQQWIPALWEDLGDITALIRTHYMEVVTRLYRENFSFGLGNWCREHGVMYIGHVIEDNNAHMRLGYGSGHYFRALDGQDMAGMDIVLMQAIPGMIDFAHRVPLEDKGYVSSKFYHYTLPKLAASHAHLQPIKKGRAMCEIFGAYGWAEGLPFMKQLADLMLVNGINHFVPHAFSPKDNDSDCPPHFYAEGRNPQYPLFGKLMSYMSRTAHVLSGGIHQADVAVFYNAEGEWTGGRNESFQEICAHLTRNLVDYDIVPFDILVDKKTYVKEGKLHINGECFGALIVSESEIMPYDRLKCFWELAKQGLLVVFTNAFTQRAAEGTNIVQFLHKFKIVQTHRLADYLKEKELCSIRFLEGETPYLRYYHIKRDGEDIYMFSNDDIRHTLDTWISVPQSGKYLLYDAWGNKCYWGEVVFGRLHLHIEKGNAVIVVFGGQIQEETPEINYKNSRVPLKLLFDIYVKEVESEEYLLYASQSPCIDISAPEHLPSFNGEVMYRTVFSVDKEYDVLDLGEVGETAQVWINGKYIGTRINAPYKFDVKEAMHAGENELDIRVLSNPAHARRDYLSHYIQIPPTGVLGEIFLN